MIIVGAGIIGLSCAWRLAQRGHRVIVFDSREAGAEASWAGAGMLAPGGEVDEESPLTRMALESLSLYPAFVAELQEISGITVDYQRCGALELAYSEDEARRLEGRAARQAAIGIPSELTTYKGSVSARFFPEDQLIAPRDVTRALQVACLRAGVLLREWERVTEVMPDGLGVVTAQGKYRDDSVLIAAGAWSSGLCGRLPVTTPVRGHLVAWRPARKLIGSILRHDGTYLLERRDGLLIAGSSTEHVGFDRRLDDGVVSEIRLRASRLLPELAEQAPVERWNGFRPGIEGGIPWVGRVAGTAIRAAFGHYRNGILLAPVTARLIADSAG